MEEWRTIQDFPDYEVSSLGRIRSYRCYGGKGRKTIPVLKNPVIHSVRGYYYTSLVSITGKNCCRDIHRLVGLSFLSPVEGKTTLDHINQDKLDNRVCNLRWANQTEQNVNRKEQRDLHHIHKTYNNTTNPYVVEARRDGARVLQHYCSTVEEAIQVRDDFLRADTFKAPGSD